MTTYTKPLPVVNSETAPFWKYCKQHELRMQKCSACGTFRFPPSPICPKCHSMESEWTKLSGKGKVYSFTIYRRSFHPSFEGDMPYDVAVIHLDEGTSMVSNVTGCKMEDLKIDMPVEVYFEDINEEFALPKFKPAN